MVQYNTVIILQHSTVRVQYPTRARAATERFEEYFASSAANSQKQQLKVGAVAFGRNVDLVLYMQSMHNKRSVIPMDWQSCCEQILSTQVVEKPACRSFSTYLCRSQSMIASFPQSRPLSM